MRDTSELVSHPNVVATLDTLSKGPLTLAELTATTGAGRRAVSTALRHLAAHGLMATSAGGSWDGPPSQTTACQLTDRGRALVERLSHLSAWTQMLEARVRPAHDHGVTGPGIVEHRRQSWPGSPG